MRSTRVLAATTLCAGALATGAIMAPSASASTPQRDADDVHGGVTTVVLNPALLPALTGTLEVAPVAPATVTAPGGVVQAAFPITEVEGKVIEHSGGLRFTPVGGGSLVVTDFDVDLRTGFLDARARLDAKLLPGRVDLFRLGPVRPIDGRVPSCEGTQAGLTLTTQAAQALGAPSFAGAFVGDACVVPGEDADD
jgi:hypothetical protein